MHTSFFAGGIAVNPCGTCNPACTANSAARRKPVSPSTAARYTLAVMEAKPGSSKDGPAADAAAAERYGPLQVRRLVKDDGRALIVYRREEPPKEPER